MTTSPLHTHTSGRLRMTSLSDPEPTVLSPACSLNTPTSVCSSAVVSHYVLHNAYQPAGKR
jgi:hypothetical protein